MKLLKKCMAIFGYLLLLCMLLGFRLKYLIDIKQLILVAAGGIILSLPSLSWKKLKKPSKTELVLWADCALYASFLETFVLLFILLSNVKNTEQLFDGLAFHLRPLLYGFCIWHIFGSAQVQQVEKEEVSNSVPLLSASESYHVFQRLGLTKRESEVAVLVCQGLGNGEIADQLSIAEATVKRHVSNIFEKFQINKREQVYTYLCDHAQDGE